MNEARARPRWVGWAAFGLAVLLLALVAPAPTGEERVAWVDARLDPTLRVPYASVAVRGPGSSLEPGDYLLQVALSRDEAVEPGDRRGLARLLEARPQEGLHVSFVRNGQRHEGSLSHASLESGRVLADNWRLIALAGTLVAFGLAVLVGSRHPVAVPIYFLSLLLGIAGIGQLDVVRPHDAGWLGWPPLRARMTAFAATLAPAAFLHFAMRFPVVGRPFRGPTFPLIVFGFWLLVAGFAQLRFADAQFANALERLSWGALGAAVVVHAVASLVSAAQLATIERARAATYVIGLAIAIAIPATIRFAAGPGALAHHATLLAAFAVPLSLAWAIIRYRLLDPSRGFTRVLSAGTWSVCALCVLALLLDVSHATTGVGSYASVGLVVGATALGGSLLLAARNLFESTVARRLGVQRGPGELVAASIRRIEGARGAEEIHEAVRDLIQHHFRPAAVVVHPIDDENAGALARAGVALWRDRGEPRHGVVHLPGRSEDPGAERAEVVLPLHPASGERTLVVLSARRDALPYGDDEVQALEGLGQAATLALGSAATTRQLEGVVRRKTASLTRSLEDHSRVLATTRAINEAATAEDVLDLIEDFARTSFHRLDDDSPAEVRRSRRGEMAPLIKTVQIFGDLAVARLGLVDQLETKVAEQAGEIAEITSRRLHAEFVRDVAHELRKPTEEVHLIAARIEGTPSDEELVRRVRSATAEMRRRLDLLLYHSGLRFDLHRMDLVKLTNDAMARISVVEPRRSYRVEHEHDRMPMMADPSRLLSVLENLLDNAVKATDAGDRITLRTRLREGGWVRIEVEDEGAGIPDGEARRIFEPGVSLRPGGFGLGLALCREIVAGHGGRISLSTDRGSTRFVLDVPQVRSAHVAETRPEADR